MLLEIKGIIEIKSEDENSPTFIWGFPSLPESDGWDLGHFGQGTRILEIKEFQAWLKDKSRKDGDIFNFNEASIIGANMVFTLQDAGKALSLDFPHIAWDGGLVPDNLPLIIKTQPFKDMKI